MKQIENRSGLNDCVNNSTLGSTQNEWRPDNATQFAEIYGQGYFVGLVSGIMALEDCTLSEALKMVRQSDNFYDLNPNCIPTAWHQYFVFENGKLVDLL